MSEMSREFIKQEVRETIKIAQAFIQKLEEMEEKKEELQKILEEAEKLRTKIEAEDEGIREKLLPQIEQVEQEGLKMMKKLEEWIRRLIKLVARILKGLFKDIEEEIKEKGKYSPTLGAWEVKSDISFDALRYGYELNSTIRSKALKVLEVLHKAFPFIPYEEIKSMITSQNDAAQVIVVKESPERNLLFYPYSSDRRLMKPVYALIDLCEKLEKPEVLLEFQKPLILALAYIFSKKEKEFSKADFPELKPIVLDCAINLALEKEWIVRKTKDSYEIREKPKFYIKCPHCGELIEAHEEYCPSCGLYLLNIILRYQKSTEEDIELYARDEKKDKWMAFFYYVRPTAKIKVGEIEVRDPLTGEVVFYREEYYNPLEPLWYALGDAVKLRLMVEVPDYLYYAKCYTNELFGLIPLPEVRYYKVEGETVKKIRDKLTMILDLIKEKIEEDYEKKKDSPYFSYYRGRKEDFVKDVLEICKKCFTPRLDEHPILRLAEEDFKDREVGQRGQIIEGVKPAEEVEVVEPSRVRVPGFPQELLAKYEPLELLGEGGFARVFKVKRRAGGGVVALKVLNEKRASDVLAREVAAWLLLDHKNVAKLYGVGKDPVPHLEIELVEGVKIGGKKLVRDLGGLPKPIDVKLAIKLVRG